jgi:hypothetical protein
LSCIATIFWAALTVWGLAGIFLFIFTCLLSYTLSRQKKYKRLLPTLEPESGRTTHWSRSLAAGFFGTWSPAAFYLILTYGFWVLLDHWAENRNKTAVSWTAIVSNSAIDKEKRTATANSLDFSSWEQQLGQLTSSVGEIKDDLNRLNVTMEKLTAVTPTPTLKGKDFRRRRYRSDNP